MIIRTCKMSRDLKEGLLQKEKIWKSHTPLPKTLELHIYHSWLQVESSW